MCSLCAWQCALAHVQECTQELANAGVVFSDLAFAENVAGQEVVEEDPEQAVRGGRKKPSRGSRGRGRERPGRVREQKDEGDVRRSGRRGRKKKSKARISPYAPD
jgi:hypothetical protein